MKKRGRFKMAAATAVSLALMGPLWMAQAQTAVSANNVSASSVLHTHPQGPYDQTATQRHPLQTHRGNGQTMDIGSHWTELGPSPLNEPGNTATRQDSGRVASIAVSETKNGETIYAGAANGGVWSSVNSGSNWQPLTDQQSSLATGSVAVDPNNPNVIYVGTGEQHFSADSRYGQGILKSTDGGKSWTLLGTDIFGGVHIGKVAVDPNNSSNVWVAADNGLWQSIDGGITWNQMFAGEYDIWPFGHIEFPTDVYIDAKTPGVIYLSVKSGGLYKSTDNGQSFDLMGGTDEDGTGLPNYINNVPAKGYHMFNASLAVVEGGKDNPDTIYTAYSDRNGNLIGMYVSKDSGSTWTQLTNVPQYFDVLYSYLGTYDPTQASGQGWYDNVIAVDPTNPKHIIAGGITLVESWDGGQSWKTLDIFFNPSQNSIDIHPDQHAIVFDSKGNAFVGNDGGVFEETADGHWHNLNSNLDTVTFYPGLSALNGGKLIFAGAQDNGSSLFGGQQSWSQLLGGDGGYTYVDPNNNNVMFAESQFGYILRSTDGGMNWNDAMPAYMNPTYVDSAESQASMYAPFVTPYVGRPLKTGGHEIIVGADLVYRSNDDGTSYTPISPYLGTISTVAESQANPNVIYVGTTNGQIFVTFSGGGTDPSNWRLITPFETNANYDRSQMPDGAGQVSAIAINPSNDKEITVTYGSSGYYSPWNGNHVYWTSDTSAQNPNWTNVSANLPSGFATSATYVGNAIAIGTEQGVFMTKPGTTNWAQIGSDLPNAPVTSLVYAGNGKLIAGTYGRGAFRLELGADAMKVAGGK